MNFIGPLFALYVLGLFLCVCVGIGLFVRGTNKGSRLLCSVGNGLVYFGVIGLGLTGPIVVLMDFVYGVL